MAAISPLRFLILSMALLAVAVQPTGIGSVLTALGMDGRAARIAGSQLTVMAAFCGAGFLLIGIAGWARTNRLRRISALHVELLDHLAQSSEGSARVIEDEGAVIVSEFDGLRATISIAPERGGQVVITASCSAHRQFEIWPRGLGPEEGDHEVVTRGSSWEIWSTPGGPVLAGAEDILETSFGEVGVVSVTHDRFGIRLDMPNAPAENLVYRLETAIRLVSSIARLNR